MYGQRNGLRSFWGVITVLVPDIYRGSLYRSSRVIYRARPKPTRDPPWRENYQTSIAIRTICISSTRLLSQTLRCTRRGEESLRFVSPCGNGTREGRDLTGIISATLSGAIRCIYKYLRLKRNTWLSRYTKFRTVFLFPVF